VCCLNDWAHNVGSCCCCFVYTYSFVRPPHVVQTGPPRVHMNGRGQTDRLVSSNSVTIGDSLSGRAFDRRFGSLPLQSYMAQ
jgi:hypothetical protein